MNSNCLDGMRCPSIKCGSYEPFRIWSGALFDVYDNGSSEFQQMQWEEGEHCVCIECGHKATVRDFTDNWVVTATEEHEDTPSVVFGPAKKALCDAFFDGTQYVNDSSLELSLRSWDAYASEKEGGE